MSDLVAVTGAFLPLTAAQRKRAQRARRRARGLRGCCGAPAGGRCVCLEKAAQTYHAKKKPTRLYRCSACGERSHTARTCKVGYAALLGGGA